MYVHYLRIFLFDIRFCFRKVHLSDVALDVIENELGLYYNDYKYKVIGNHELSILRDMPNVLLTPHMAFYTEQAVSDMVEHSIESIVADRDGKENKFRVC